MGSNGSIRLAVEEILRRVGNARFLTELGGRGGGSEPARRIHALNVSRALEDARADGVRAHGV